MISQPIPDFVSARQFYRHTISSALLSLLHLKVPPDNIRLKYDPNGDPFGLVLAQQPAPGVLMDSSTLIELTISGFGFVYQMPVSIRTTPFAQNQGVGIDSILQGVDGAWLKAYFLLLQSFRMFDIREDNPAACARWIELFGLDPEDWPEERWFRLSLLLPSLHNLSGTVEGLRVVLRNLLDLPLFDVSYVPDYVDSHRFSQVSFLADQSYVFDEHEKLHRSCNNTLGLNSILGDRVEIERRVCVQIGPLSLHQWDWVMRNELRQLRLAVELILPINRNYEIRASVGNLDSCPSLNEVDPNRVLGVSSHLGHPDFLATGSVLLYSN